MLDALFTPNRSGFFTSIDRLQAKYLRRARLMRPPNAEESIDTKGSSINHIEKLL
ncbi:hypothetical protein QT971_16960 [Microcoleus sp. herbarium19]|uniref:hypothetical protein n=1 Tax=unclassified Microcoleus TaxID=2642155 RepID=UPI002FD6FE1C